MVVIICSVEEYLRSKLEVELKIADSALMGLGPAEPTDFLSTFNFDL